MINPDLSDENKNLLRSLPILHLDSKIELWLVLTGNKPATEIYVLPRYYNTGENILEVTDADIKQIEVFLQRNNLFFLLLSETNNRPNPFSAIHGLIEIHDRVFLVASDKKTLDEFSTAWKSRETPSPVNDLIFGKAFGFPNEAVQAYVNNPESLSSIIANMQHYQKENWIPYLSYSPRNKHPEDLRVAKRWAKIIKTDLPDIAEVYEKRQRAAYQI